MRRPQSSRLRRLGVPLVVVLAVSVPLTALGAHFAPGQESGSPTASAASTDTRPTGATPRAGASGGPRRTATPTPRAEATAASTATERPTARDSGRDGGRSRRTATTAPDDAERRPPDRSETRCAVSVLPEGDTERSALTAADERYGGVEVSRVYERVPAPWPESRAGQAGRDVIVSLKMKPDDVLSGRYDDRLRAWFVNAPRDRVIYWSLHHEPEDNVEDGEFTTEQFRRAWRHVARLAEASDHPRLYATLILMDWTLDPRSGRNWKDYYVEQDTDVLAFDVYNHGEHQDPPEYYSAEKQLATIVETARRAGKPFGIAELGSIRLPNDPDGSGRAAWIADLTRYLEKHDALWVAYFDINHDANSDYRLRDEPSIAAWRDFCAR